MTVGNACEFGELGSQAAFEVIHVAELCEALVRLSFMCLGRMYFG